MAGRPGGDTLSRSAPRALVFSPWLHVLGGGERYALSLGRVLAERFDVTIGAPVIPTDRGLAARGMSLPGHGLAMSLDEFTEVSGAFDTVICMSTALPPASRARRSWVVVQFPYSGRTEVAQGSMARARWNLRHYRCVTYSRYVRRWLLTRWGAWSTVVPPPVTLGSFDPLVKEPLIVAVGRFFPGAHTKRQDVLLEAYGALPSALRDTWKLVLAGGVGPEGVPMVEELRPTASELGVALEVDLGQAELMQLLSRAGLFWQATGYGRHRRDPGAAEHFGISVVEAMSFGAVPLVYGDGGHLETTERRNRWRSVAELVAKTSMLAGDDGLRSEWAMRASGRSLRYGEAAFAARVRAVFFDD